MKPAIVIVAFNRPRSLERLLNSISVAHFVDHDIPLVISIDFQNSESHNEVKKIAKGFNWEFGPKRIIEHSENIGLRKHILSCGDLSSEYGCVIVLEDDLYVSPCFYQYTIRSQSYYSEDKKISGVSLYNHKLNFNVRLPFEPIQTDSDVYFLQIASSWGQSWTNHQWILFKEWYLSNQETANFSKVSSYVQRWPNTSWLKYHILYLVETERYFVYPKESLTTNFSDTGTHNKIKNTDTQVPLLLEEKDYKFEQLLNSNNKYDCFFEILPIILKNKNNKFKDIDFTVDLYGSKRLDQVHTTYLLSSKDTQTENETLGKFGLEFKPVALNILLNYSGNHFTLAQTSGFIEKNKMNEHNIKAFQYFFIRLSLKAYLKLIINKLTSKLW